MTLREIYNTIEDVVSHVPDIRTVVENNILRLNELRNVEYAVFSIVQETHTSRDGWVDFRLNLFFIDRLVNAEDNEVEAQSHAIEVLRAVLTRLNESLEVSDIQYTTFTQRFQDLCAGAWASVTIHTPQSDCDTIFDD